jgi:Outer membrane protein beta-barrel domain
MKAQERFHAGVRAGLCGSQVNGDRLEGFNKLGIVAGLYVKRKFSEKFTGQMELVFIQKGSRKPTDDYNSYYRLRVHYIEVPVLLQYKASAKLSVYAGPSFGTLIFSGEDSEFGPYRNILPFSKFELSGNAGVLYKLSDDWAFDARYSASITTIRPFPVYNPYNSFFDKGEYNLLIEFSLLYDF